MSKRDDAYKPFLNIKKRLEEVAESLGLEVAKVFISVDDDHLLQVVWTVKPDAVMTEVEKEQRRVDNMFNDQMTGFDDPIETKADKARASLQAMLDGYALDEEAEDEPEGPKALGTGEDNAD